MIDTHMIHYLWYKRKSYFESYSLILLFLLLLCSFLCYFYCY